MISNVEKIRLSWLKFMLVGSFVIFFSLISVVLNQYFRWEENIPVELIYVFIFVLLIFITTTLFKSLNQPEIFSGITSNEVKDIPKYAASTLTEEESSALTDKLSGYMKTEKPYLDPDLSIKELAEKIESNVKDLSQIINNNLGLRFFDFVNKYRIQDAVLLIKNPPDPKMTILEVMYEVGFNSKSSFNTAFKKFTGTTPSEFKKNDVSDGSGS
jgi:AraC-like DNA-binding protein